MYFLVIEESIDIILSQVKMGFDLILLIGIKMSSIFKQFNSIIGPFTKQKENFLPNSWRIGSLVPATIAEGLVTLKK